MEPISDVYGSGENLPLMHPDRTIDSYILIEELCIKLDTARRGLEHALSMNVVTPAAVAMKKNIRWALDETHPKTFHEEHPNHD
mgnify:CR=1 FL=1